MSTAYQVVPSRSRFSQTLHHFPRRLRYSIIIGILVLAGLIALMLAIVNPIR